MRERGERWGPMGVGLGLGAGAGWAGWALALGRRGRMGGPGCWAPLSLSKENKNKTEIGKKRKRG